LYAFFEYHLTRGDYRRPEAVSIGRHGWRTGHPSAIVREDADARVISADDR
jgi:hypothetical protein